MRVTLNGKPRQINDGLSVAGLIEALDLAGQRVAVERNGEIVPRKQFDRCALAEGDTLEIVTLVGGG